MKQVNEVLKACHKYKSFLIVSHQNPDADAVASVLAMAVFLRSLGKKVLVVNMDAVPQWLTFLPKAKIWKQASMLKVVKFDAAIVLDCGDLSRIGSVKQFLAPGKPVINVDHHITNDHFGSINCILPKTSSTCEIVFEILKAAHFPIDKQVATLLYAGIMTDTGSFRYDNSRPRTHEIAAKLMAHNINAQDLYDRLYVGIPVKDMKLFTQVIHGAELLLNNRVYCLCLDANTIASFSSSFDLKEKLFGFFRSVQGVELVVILTEVNEKEIRINLRSQGDFNVAEFALQFDGGGHRKAAGGRIMGRLNNAKKKIITAIAKEIGVL